MATAAAPTPTTGSAAAPTLATGTTAKSENQPMQVPVAPIQKNKYTKRVHPVRNDEPQPS